MLASLLGMSREEETACRVEVANARRAASSSTTFGSYVPEVDLGMNAAFSYIFGGEGGGNGGRNGGTVERAAAANASRAAEALVAATRGGAADESARR